MEPGEPMLLPCTGGPAGYRAVTYPPPVEIDADDGVYVLVDHGPPETWTYEFVGVGSP